MKGDDGKWDGGKAEGRCVCVCVVNGDGGSGCRYRAHVAPSPTIPPPLPGKAVYDFG